MAFGSLFDGGIRADAFARPSLLNPKILKAGIITLDPVSTQVARIIVLQYNPDQLSRTLQVQGMSGEPGDRAEALRLKGPPIETFKLEAEIDAAEQLEFPEQNAVAAEVGIFPQLTVLESLITPSSNQLTDADSFLSMGAVEIAPMEAPLALFVWSVQRVVPVRVTELSITEDAFDTSLNPIRAKVTLAMRTLSVNDLGFAHRGGKLYIAYLKNKEALTQRFVSGSIDDLGLKSNP